MQEIGPRFTLKLRSMRKGLPAVKNLGETSKNLEFDTFEEDDETNKDAPRTDKESTMHAGEINASEHREDSATPVGGPTKVVPPKEDEYLWMWKVSNF